MSTLLFIFCQILSVLPVSINNSNCKYLYVSPDVFRYNGWYEYSNNKNTTWYYMTSPDIIQLLIYENQWYFYNSNNKNESYKLSLSLQSTNIYSIVNSTTKWNLLKDGSAITLNVECIETRLSSHQEQISWIINDENCHDKPRTYVGLSHTNKEHISAYWIEPTLSNHTSNVTVSIYGTHNHQYAIGKHKITYAARSEDYFIMCQITLYIIGVGDVNEEYMNQCINLDFIVDANTLLIIDPNKYTYNPSYTSNNPTQLLYITPQLVNKHITCYINIQWAEIGDMISYDSNSYPSDSPIWKLLIVLCTIAIFALLVERIYFYYHIHKRKYQSVEDDTELSELDPIQTQFDGKYGYRKTRSLSLHPFTRTPIKDSLFENDEIVPLSMDTNDTKRVKTRNRRYMSVPTNLMSDNVLKNHKKMNKENIVNETDWGNELRFLKEHGFSNKEKCSSMLSKYAVKNENKVTDKKMTQSIVIKILEKDRKRGIQCDEMEHFLEDEWGNEK